jgi:serine phosphatase RsbU (regulator of sigma subunit)
MRLSFKLLLILELVILVAVLVLVFPVWRTMRGQVIENMQNELKAIASTAALAVDGDLHTQIRDAADADSEAFRTLREQLRLVQEANGVQYDHLYTFYRDGDRMRFAVMLHETPFVGDEYPIQPLMHPVLDGGSMEATTLYEDEHGRWISAYAPIRDSNGQVVGLLEVDKNSAMYLAEFYHYTRLTAGIGLLALAIGSLLLWLVLQKLVIRPLSVVRDGIVALGRQDFAHQVRLNTNDEFEDLARTFNDITKQLNAAKVIQAGFFPRALPDTETYSIAGLSVPCDAAGGDYYDAFELPDGRVVIVIADVSGHGLGASLIMASCRSLLRALSRIHADPARVIGHLNRSLEADLSSGRFITMIYGVLEPDGRFTYCNAGHGPAYIVHDGRADALTTHLPPVGVVIDDSDAADDTQTTIRLEPGDRLFLASDGLNESMDPNGVQFGLENVRRFVSDTTCSASKVIQDLLEAMQMHCRCAITTDDVTLLCVDRR